MINFVLHWCSVIVPWVVMILGCLTLLSLLLTWIYILGKRIIANVWGQKVLMEFLYSRYSKKRETITIDMGDHSKEEDE